MENLPGFIRLIKQNTRIKIYPQFIDNSLRYSKTAVSVAASGPFHE
jgi:hypothetical protein